MTATLPPTPSAALRVAIFCPLAFEYHGIRRELRRAFRASEGADPFRLVQSGPGPVAIEQAVEAFGAGLAPDGPRPLAVLAGVAGELVPGSSDVHAFAEVTSADGASWRSRLETLGDAGLVILGLNVPACTPEEKAGWREESGATFVDTESHAFARACHRLRIPWVIVRGVSDRRHERLPDQAAHWVDQKGNTRLGRVLADLLRTPSLLPAMIRLGRRGGRVLPMVARRIAQLIDALPGAERHASLVHAPGASPAAAVPITPLPERLVRAEPPLILLCGGSFDPPHRAHTELPAIVRDQLELRLGCQGRAWMVYLPAARSPLKAAGPVAPDADRVAMLRLALAGTDRACLWTDEIDRAGPPAASAPSYTIETVRRLLALLGDSPPTLRLLIGQDQAAQFHRWHEAKELLRLAEPVVLVRRDAGAPIGPADTDSFIDALRRTGAWSEPELVRWRARTAGETVPLIDISSTDIRRTLAAPGTDEAAARSLLGGVHPDVLVYIRDRSLYRAEPA